MPVTKLTNNNRNDFNTLYQGLNNIYYDDTSLLKGNEKLKNYIEAFDTLRYSYSTEEKIAGAYEKLKDFPDFLKDGDEFNTNYNLIKFDGDRNNNNLDPEEFEKALNTLQTLSGIEIDKTAIEDAQRAKIIHANEIGVDPETKMTRPVVESEVISLEGIKVAGKIGKNFFEPGCKEYNDVETMLTGLGEVLQNLNKNIEVEGEKKDFDSLETRKLRDKLVEFRDAVETIRKAGQDDSNITSEQAEKALDTVKGMPAFLMGSYGKTNYQRLMEGLDDGVFRRGMNALEKSLRVGISMDTIEKAMPKINYSFKANESIEADQDYIKKNKAELQTNSEVFKETITRIMATRMTVNSILGNGKSLDIRTNSIERDKTQQKLLENKHFRDFLSTLVSDPKKVSTALSVARSGHGGGLDKMFTAYLKTRPAGELHNDPAIKRFMPTVKERIESLQSQAGAAYAKDKTAPVAEMAEIAILRQMTTIKGFDKPFLDVQIPNNRDLSKEVDIYTKNTRFDKICQNPDVLEKVRKGHGGDMLKNMFKLGASMKQLEQEAKQGAESAKEANNAANKNGGKQVAGELKQGEIIQNGPKQGGPGMGGMG